MDELDWDEFKKKIEPKKKVTKKAEQPEFVSETPVVPEIPKKEIKKVQMPSSGFSDFVDQFSYKAERYLKKGDVQIDATLDLHGLFLEDAHQKTRYFIKNSFALGRRVVIIVTGKGSHDKGVIKTEFPHWLEEADLRTKIIRFKQAHIKHGGTGAYYVFLKKNKE